MFRGCYFEYNNISSERYNLMLFYINNNNMNFDSGGKFDIKTDNLPNSYERLYYGKDYSANPLEFDVEIVTPQGNISKEKMAEIKNWLFHQDGWKDLAVTDDTKRYHLKCLFEPDEDITDANGYRGLKCKIRNISPFWYGDEKEITLDSVTLSSATDKVALNSHYYTAFEITIPDNDYVDFYINPTIIANVDKRSSSLGNNVGEFRISSTDATTMSDAKSITDNAWTYPNTSELWFDISFVGDKGNSDSYDTITANTKYVTLSSERHPSQDISISVDTSNPVPIFRMGYGTHYYRVRYAANYSSLVFKYTPVYRMGAF